MKSQSGTIISQRRSINVLQNSLWRSVMAIGLYSFDRCFKYWPRQTAGLSPSITEIPEVAIKPRTPHILIL